MARASTTSDVFNAVAEPRRREILELLRSGERPVFDIATHLGVAQPSASKHVRVLREVGLVRVRRVGTQRYYGICPQGLEPIREWVGGFEEFWNASFDRLDCYVEELAASQEGQREEAP